MKNIFIFTIILLIVGNRNLISQNEAFKGGKGDGFGFSSAVFSFAETANPLNVIIDLAENQNKYTNTEPVVFVVKFSKKPVEFSTNHLLIEGSSVPDMIQIQGDSLEYEIFLSGFEQDGNVTLEIPAGIIIDPDGNSNTEAISLNNEVFINKQGLSASISRDTLLSQYVNTLPVNFEVIFNKKPTGLNAEDIIAYGSANPSGISVIGTDSVFKVVIEYASEQGEIYVSIPSGKVSDIYGNFNQLDFISPEPFYYDSERPGVEIKLADGQNNLTYELPIKFKLDFTENISGLENQQIAVEGTNNPVLSIEGEGNTYLVTVNNILLNETVTISVPEGLVFDMAGNANLPSINTANSVTLLGSTGIENLMAKHGFRINSNKGLVSIELNNLSDQKNQVSVFDLQGKFILRKNLVNGTSTLQLEPMHVYLFRLTLESNIYTGKIFVK